MGGIGGHRISPFTLKLVKVGSVGENAAKESAGNELRAAGLAALVLVAPAMALRIAAGPVVSVVVKDFGPCR
jgi:hypothetical protein